MTQPLKIGTRGSALALWQAHHVAELLRAELGPVRPIEIVVIRTTGDARPDIPLGQMAGKGVFVREIESALERGEVDMAVHSCKDLPSVDPPGLHIAAFCAREDPRDALVTPHAASFAALPQGAVVATSAPRRVAQLRLARPDLRFVEIRGNVDTRLAKVARGDADALILAAAGLMRLGRGDAIVERLPVDLSLPQVGQGCVAVQCRVNDREATRYAAAACDHSATRTAVTIERQFLARMGGGCTAPVAAHARIIDESIRLDAFVALPNSSTFWRADGVCNPAAANALADSVFEKIVTLGAGTIL